MQKKIDKRVQIFNVTISGTHKSEVLRKIRLQRKNLYHVATVNPEFVMETRRNPRFAKVLGDCDLAVADGWGIVWALRLAQGKELDRISGGQLVGAILEHANKSEKKVFLLGGREGVAKLAAKKICENHPYVRVEYFEGAKRAAVEGSDEAALSLAKINAFEPDYLLVAYGSPWQDIWIEDNRPYLRVGLAIGVGGVLDEIAGVVPICPKWLDELGLKWLFRLITQPARLPRILRVIQFGVLVVAQSIKNRYIS